MTIAEISLPITYTFHCRNRSWNVPNSGSINNHTVLLFGSRLLKLFAVPFSMRDASVRRFHSQIQKEVNSSLKRPSQYLEKTSRKV